MTWNFEKLYVNGEASARIQVYWPFDITKTARAAPLFLAEPLVPEDETGMALLVYCIIW